LPRRILCVHPSLSLISLLFVGGVDVRGWFWWWQVDVVAVGGAGDGGGGGSGRCCCWWWQRRCWWRVVLVVMLLVVVAVGGEAGDWWRRCWWRRQQGGTAGGLWARWPADLNFFVLENVLCWELSGLTAHVYREGLRWLSAKGPLPAQLCRVACVECFLSVEVLPRGKPLVPRVRCSPQMC
jgi:hypothetical protein